MKLNTEVIKIVCVPENEAFCVERAKKNDNYISFNVTRNSGITKFPRNVFLVNSKRCI